MRITSELFDIAKGYMKKKDGYQFMEFKNGCCPLCNGKVMNKHSDHINGTVSESMDVCNTCGFAEEYAYGASRSSFQGHTIEDDYGVQLILMGMLRKVFIFGELLDAKEDELVEGLLGIKTMTQEEFSKLELEIVENARMKESLK